MEALHKFRNVLNKIVETICIVLFAMMVVVGTYQIVTRFIFNSPSTISEELLTYSFAWMAMFASAYVFGKRDHGMVVGNLISGRLSDRYTPGKVGTAAQALICSMLLLIFFLSPYKWAAALLMCLCTAGLFAVSSPEQILIIRVSKGGEMLGAACVQVAFNLGNAIGAYAGGLAVSGGYRYPALAGVPFALIGFTLFLIFYKKYQARITEDDIIEND